MGITRSASLSKTGTSRHVMLTITTLKCQEKTRGICTHTHRHISFYCKTSVKASTNHEIVQCLMMTHVCSSLHKVPPNCSRLSWRCWQLHSVTANSTITMAELSVHMTGIMIATLLVTVPRYYGAGWWFDSCLAANLNGRYYPGVTAASQMASTGAPGIFWLTIAQGNDTHSRVLKWKLDLGGAKEKCWFVIATYFNEIMTCNYITPDLPLYWTWDFLIIVWKRTHL